VARGLHKFLIAEELGSRDPTSNLSTMRRARKLSWRPPTPSRPIPRSASTGRLAMREGRPCSRPSMPRACASVRRCPCPPMLLALEPGC
jgi:hypothetical protein